MTPTILACLAILYLIPGVALSAWCHILAGGMSLDFRLRPLAFVAVALLWPAFFLGDRR